VAYFHAGVDTLRSKSMDRNSYDSGDWFNRLDWTGQDNHFGTGLPPQQDNAARPGRSDAAAAGRSAIKPDAGRDRAGRAMPSATCCASAAARRCSVCARPTTSVRGCISRIPVLRRSRLWSRGCWTVADIQAPGSNHSRTS
jgi:hypothetical protein